jgi:two-component system, NarL family, vancomycin resistance associated response regulator VraR
MGLRNIRPMIYRYQPIDNKVENHLKLELAESGTAMAQTAETVKVLIVDNNEMVRAFLKYTLSRYADVQIVGMGVNGVEAIALNQRLEPDVILMDLQMPIMDGLTASVQIKQEFPEVKIIAFTSMDEQQAEIPTESGWFDQFCGKDTKAEALVSFIRQCKQQRPAYR